jgi:hypothetical protein
MYVEPSLKKETDILKTIRKNFIIVGIIIFLAVTAYNGYVAYNMKSDNELISEEISKANSTFENIKILNARVQHLEHKHEILANCVDYLEMQFIRSRNVESTSAEYSIYKDKCQNSVTVSYLNHTLK